MSHVGHFGALGLTTVDPLFDIVTEKRKRAEPRDKWGKSIYGNLGTILIIKMMVNEKSEYQWFIEGISKLKRSHPFVVNEQTSNKHFRKKRRIFEIIREKSLHKEPFLTIFDNSTNEDEEDDEETKRGSIDRDIV